MSTAAMRYVDPLLMELDRESANTRKLLERLPEAKLSFKPHPKSFTLAQLATHVATLPDWGSALAGEGFDIATAPAPGEPPKTVAEILAKHDGAVKAGKAAIARMDNDEAMKPWTLRKGGQELFSIPKIAVVRGFILNHLIHHRGQLTVYLRLLDVPLPPIFGPTADESPF